MAQLVVSAAGAAVGFMVGGPAGAQWGWMAGSLIGAVAFTPTQKNEGPRLDDLKVTGLAYGQPIPFIQGTVRAAGQLAWASDRREIATTTRADGKGGPKVKNTTYTYEIDALYVLSSNELAGLIRVWDNGKLVYSIDDSTSDGSLIASSETDLWRRITFYGGDEAQLPDPTYEAVVGAGNAPAYRGMGTVFIEGLQLGNSGQLPNLTFEVGTNLTPAVMQNYQDMGPSALPVSDYFYSTGLKGFLGCVNGQGKFGASGEFTGAGGADSEGLTLGSVVDVPPLGAQNWTFQCYLKSKGATYLEASGTIVSTTPNETPIQGLWVRFDADGALQGTFRYDNPGTIFNVSLSSSPAIYSLGVLFHLAVERSGSEIMAYINGVLVAQASLPSAGTSIISDSLWSIGSMASGRGDVWNGFIDDVSLSSEAIYNGQFTPPEEPYRPDQRTLFNIPFYRVDTVVRGNETIRTVVERLCARAEMPVGTYDASALDAITKPVRSLAVSQVGGTRATLELLGQVYFFTAICTDKVYFVPRAQSIVATIPFRDLGAAQAMEDSPEPFALRKRSDIEVPAQEALTYANASDDYQSDTQFSDRLLSSQTNTGTTSVPMAFTPSEAKAIADARVTDSAISMIGAPLQLSRQYSMLTPGDSVLVEADDGSTFRMLLERLTMQSGVMAFDARLEDATVFTQAGITGGDYSPQTEVVAIPGTYLLMMDIPLLRDADDGIGLYSAARGLSQPWPGAQLFVSTDNIGYEPVQAFSESAVLGVTTTAPGNWTRTNVFDDTSTVTVSIGPGALSSITRDQLLNSTTLNAALIGNEIVQFRSASMLSAGVYLLSGLLRGRRGTDRVMTGHTVGERFVLLQPTGMRRIPQGQSDLSVPRYFRAVTFGRALSTASTQTATNDGVSMMPFAPVDARANRNTTSTVISWNRRTRLESRFLGPLSSSVPLGEATEAYEVEIYATSGFATVKRTLSSATPSVTYTSADQVADFGTNQTVLYVRIYQMSETVGRGFPLQTTI